MKMLRLGAVAGLALVVAACPPRDQEVAVTEDTLAVDTPMVAPTEQPAAAPAVPADAHRTNLQAVGGSGVSGEVAAMARDDRTEIIVMVQNATPNESLGARVHSGTCESPGPELARLDAIRTDNAGRGHSQSNVGHAPHLIMDGNHIVAVYAPGAEPERDQPIACATLPEADDVTPPGA